MTLSRSSDAVEAILQAAASQIYHVLILNTVGTEPLVYRAHGNRTVGLQSQNLNLNELPGLTPFILGESGPTAEASRGR